MRDITSLVFQIPERGTSHTLYSDVIIGLDGGPDVWGMIGWVPTLASRI